MIPKKLREKLSNNPWYSKCCRCGSSPVEWHHVFQYSGKSIQEEFSIIPACKRCHDQATPHKSNYKPNIRYYFEWIAINRMTGDDLIKYYKKNWQQLSIFLNSQKEKYAWKN